MTEQNYHPRIALLSRQYSAPNVIKYSGVSARRKKSFKPNNNRAAGDVIDLATLSRFSKPAIKQRMRGHLPEHLALHARLCVQRFLNAMLGIMDNKTMIVGHRYTINGNHIIYIDVDDVLPDHADASIKGRIDALLGNRYPDYFHTVSTTPVELEDGVEKLTMVTFQKHNI